MSPPAALHCNSAGALEPTGPQHRPCRGQARAYTALVMNDPIATEIRLRTQSRVLVVAFSDGQRFELPFEYLRVYSPSAEVRGHGLGPEVLVLGKERVGIKAVEPVGRYAVKLVFDDGHDTGLYTWKYLYELGAERERKWTEYVLRKQHAAGGAGQGAAGASGQGAAGRAGGGASGAAGQGAAGPQKKG